MKQIYVVLFILVGTVSPAWSAPSDGLGTENDNVYLKEYIDSLDQCSDGSNSGGDTSEPIALGSEPDDFRAEAGPTLAETATDEKNSAECDEPTETPSCKPNLPESPWYKGGKTTMDECIWSEPGPYCDEAKTKCCDWTLTPEGKRHRCECNTDVKGKCKTGKDCAICMCQGEGEGESLECLRPILCAIKNRADKHRQNNPNSSECDAILYQEPGSDVAMFTSKKCICDNVAPGKNVKYNQKYCTCCAKRAANEEYPKAARECEEVWANLDCSPPYDTITNFLTPAAREKYGAPCDTQVKVKGNCGHEFYACQYNPR